MAILIALNLNQNTGYYRGHRTASGKALKTPVLPAIHRRPARCRSREWRCL